MLYMDRASVGMATRIWRITCTRHFQYGEKKVNLVRQAKRCSGRTIIIVALVTMLFECTSDSLQKQLMHIRENVHKSRGKQNLPILPVHIAHILKVKRWYEVDYGWEAIAEVCRAVDVRQAKAHKLQNLM